MLKEETKRPQSLAEMYSQLSPENRRKFYIKTLQLYNEQQGREVNQTDYYYFFDCHDAKLSENYMTAIEVNELITGNAAEPIKENDMVKIAAYYDAILYRYQFNGNKEPINELCLYKG